MITFTEAAKKNLRDVVRHEAGHYVVARALKFQVIDLKVSRGAGPRERDVFDGSAQLVTIQEDGIVDFQGLETYLRHRIMVLNAGALAQAFDGTVTDQGRLREIRKNNAQNDLAKAKELLSLYLNLRIRHGLDRKYMSSDTWEEHPFWLGCDKEATVIICENRPAIDRIVVAAERQFMRGDHFHPSAQMLEAIAWDAGAPRAT